MKEESGCSFTFIEIRIRIELTRKKNIGLWYQLGSNYIQDENELELENGIIVSIEWLMEMISKLISEKSPIFRNDGHLRFTDISRIWTESTALNYLLSFITLNILNNELFLFERRSKIRIENQAERKSVLVNNLRRHWIIPSGLPECSKSPEEIFKLFHEQTKREKKLIEKILPASVIELTNNHLLPMIMLQQQQLFGITSTAVIDHQQIGIVYCFGSGKDLNEFPNSFIWCLFSKLKDLIKKEIYYWKDGLIVKLKGHYRLFITSVQCSGINKFVELSHMRFERLYIQIRGPKSQIYDLLKQILLLIEELLLNNKFLAFPFKRRMCCCCSSCIINLYPLIDYAFDISDKYEECYDDAILSRVVVCPDSKENILSEIQTRSEFIQKLFYEKKGSLKGPELNKISKISSEDIRYMINQGIRKAIEYSQSLNEKMYSSGSAGNPSPQGSSNLFKSASFSSSNYFSYNLMNPLPLPSLSASSANILNYFLPTQAPQQMVLTNQTQIFKFRSATGKNPPVAPASNPTASSTSSSSSNKDSTQKPIIINDEDNSYLFDFSFQVYTPLSYIKIRESIGLNNIQYLKSVAADECLIDMHSAGKSGSYFFRSRDGLCILKTVDEDEVNVLNEMLPEYCRHICDDYPTSLLIRFLGTYTLKYTSGPDLHFVVMENILPPFAKIKTIFDLKGSTAGRIANEGESIKKDLDFVQTKGFQFGPLKANLMIEQLTVDCNFLEKYSIMDYSLLLGIAHINEHDSKNAKQNLREKHKNFKYTQIHSIYHQDAGGIQASDEHDNDVPIIYYLGIIDILQTYNIRKKVEFQLKSLTVDPETLSCVEPVTYAKRFLNFMTSNIYPPIKI